MKIFTNGSSFSVGKFPELLANRLDADLTNISSVGYSNRSIWRTTIEESPKDYDLALIQLTSPSRHEYHDEKKWVEISVALQHSRLTEERKKIWKYWYEHMYHDVYGDCEENFAIEGIGDYFAINNIPCIMITSDKYTRSKKFDLNIFDLRFPMDETRHPTEKGHQIIADRIYEIAISRL